MRILSRRGIRLTVLLLFFLSGACGLVYEVVWMRMLTLVFGATTFATSAILASFFAGLALGSWLFGRMADRRGSPLRLYGVLELGVGVCAFLMPLVFAGITEVYVAISRQTELGYYAMSLVRFALSFLVLLVPTTLMGGTLPVIVKYWVEREDRVGAGVGWLYALNTFGAVVGTVAAGFFLILLLGLREAAWAAGAVNLLIASAALGLAKAAERLPEDPADAAESAEPEATEVSEAVEVPAPEPPPLPGYATRLALVAIGISGLCALALEVIWTRSLVYFLDNSTHAFTTMLTAFLVGIALGSALIALFVDRRGPLLAWFGVLEILIGVTALLAVPVLVGTTPVMARMVGVEPDPLIHWRWTGLRFATSLTVMLVPTVLMGMTVPLVVRIHARGLEGVGGALGRVYSVNTVGGVIGSVLAGFVLIPLWGMGRGIALVAATSIALGGVLVLADPHLARFRGGRVAVGLAAAAGTAAVLLFGGDRIRLSSFKETADDETVLFYREGVGSTVKVFSDPTGAKFVSIDGFPVAGTSWGLLDAQAVLGNLPLLLSNVPQAKVGLVGFGAGGASWTSLQYDVSEVHCVELVPAVLDAAEWFPEVNHNVLDHPRYRAILDDGRNYALVTDQVYDVIAVDATSPKMAGNGSLYTVEFYELLRERISDQGIVAQWLPFHLLSEAEMRMTARSFQTVFPHTTVWLSPLRHHALLVGTKERLRVDLEAMAAKLQRPGVRHELDVMRVHEPLDVAGMFVMGEERLAAWTEGARLNTDDHPYLEFTPAMAYFYTMQYVTRNLYDLGRARESLVPWLVNTGDTPEERAAVEERVNERLLAAQHTLSGDIYYYLGLKQQAEGEYAMARIIDPDEKNWLHPLWLGFEGPELR
ncbi:MAG: hypothetical protein AMXMBFR53_43070 [Gemmatimonadota bacterium]